MLLFWPEAVWKTLVSYSMRSDRKGVAVSPGSHSSRLSAPGGEEEGTRRVTAARAETPSRRISGTRASPHHQEGREVMPGTASGPCARRRRKGPLEARRAGAARVR